MRILEYNETIVWDDPIILLIEEVADIGEGVTTSTYIVYMHGTRVVTATNKEAAHQAIRDMIAQFGFEESLSDELD